MRNLNVVQQSDKWVELPNVCHLATEEWTNSIVLSSKQTVTVITEELPYTFSSNTESEEILMCQPVGHNQFCIVTTGRILVWRVTDDEILDTFETPSRVKCVAFSPDNLTIVFVTDDHCITLLTTSLDPICTTDLNQEGFGTAAPIALGWGKKETQFHGSLGKQAALMKAEDSSSAISVHDDGHYEVCWRDDGKYFVVSYPDATLQNRRRLRVFTESGELFSTSQAINLAEPSLCWRPRVQLITTIQRRPGRGLDVIFFETNTERHGEFEVLDATMEAFFRVQQMNFEEQGNVLAVLCTPLQQGVHSSFIHLITCSNYHWSTKRKLSFELSAELDPVDSSVALTWGCVASHSGLFTLYVSASAVQNTFGKNGSKGELRGTMVRSWNFCPSYDRDSCLVGPPCHRVSTTIPAFGLVCVVDNNCIQLTAMAHSVVPPPMCSTRLILRSRSLKGEVQPNRIVSLSFPHSWISATPDCTHVPLIVQFESGSSELFTRLHIIELTLGTSDQKHQTIGDGDDVVDVQWVTGSRVVAPWPQRIRTIVTSDLLRSIETNEQPVLEALALATHFQKCGGNELTHLTWIDRTHVAYVACGGRLVGLLDLTSSSASARWLLCVNSASSTSSRVCGLCLTPGGYLCVQLSNGYVIVYILEELLRSKLCSIIPKLEQDTPEMSFLSSNRSPEIHCILKLPVACDQLAVASFTEADRQRDAPSLPIVSSPLPYRSFLLGLHESSHRLYGTSIPTQREVIENPDLIVRSINMVMDLCSSFLVLPNFLLVTSMRKLLVCIPTQFDAVTFASAESCLMELISRLTIPTELHPSGQAVSRNWYNDYLHPIETGAVLATAVPTGTAVVLQMPRGNLEQVHPRALVLTHLADLLNSTNYTEALLLMRRHRVNMNLLHDHNPVTFKKNIGILIQQVDDPELLTLFISDLLDEDVSETLYGTFYGSPTAQLYRDVSVKQSLSSMRPKALKTDSKLNGICDLLLFHISKEKRFLLPTLTCYAKKKPSELHSALLLLKNYYESGDHSSWESGIRHLQYFATPTELYRVALGTYDLELAQIMAQRTQLDPKEYLADLNALRSITASGEGDVQLACRQSYQRFKIDDYLMRFSTALKHLRSAGPKHSDELISYAEKHKLYEVALELLDDSDVEFKVISRSWANHLLAGQKLVYAGQVYLRAGLYALAARAFLSAIQPQLWSIAVTEARCQLETDVGQEDGDVVLSEQEVREQAHKMTVRLKDLGRHQEAIPIFLDILKNPDGAIMAALEGGLWLEARRLASAFTRSEVLKQWLKPKLKEAYSLLLEHVQKTHTEFSELFERLILLRRRHVDEAESRRIAQLHGNVDAAMDSATESDMFSDTSSLSESVGGLSIRSNATKLSGRSAKNRRKQEARKWSTKPGSKYEEVGLLKALSQSIELSQRLSGEVPGVAAELWRAGMPDEGRLLLQTTNQLLLEQKSAIPLIWDDWITEKDPQFQPIQQNEGRKRYPFKEPFINFPPIMNKTQVECCLLDLNCS